MNDYNVYISINGVQTNISDGLPFEVLNVSNLGPSEATRITERGPLQDGDSDTDQVLEPRLIPIVLQARPDDVTFTMKQCRALLSRLFKATNITIKFYVENVQDGDLVVIDTKSTGNIDLPLNITARNYLKQGVTLRAANPTFYDPITQIYTFALGGAGQTLVPVTVPTFVGGSTLDQTTNIYYDGTYKDFPYILAYGPITNLKIENLSTGNVLDFNGFTIGSGDYYTIDLRYGRKAVYKNGVPSDNRINELTLASTLATFAIEADPVVPGGNNTIKVTGTGLTGVSQIYVQYNRRFDGMPF